ncbi:MAG: response regulator transcription factor [Lachnospiraceae bacterium]|nr:response regulator transcription factor [Lachnospiraceae bacterium]MCM1240163.1 response regulator transcription factor [Lachnospiraceae bacterium]
MDHILIVEDDISLAKGLCRALVSPKVRTESCGTLAEAAGRLEAWGEEEMPLLLLDVNLPDGNGFDFLKKVKETWHIPVIMLTANDMEMDIVAGLEQGAEDYITKPFSLAVLRARVTAALRRRQRELPSADEERNSSHIVFGEYDLDFERMRFYVNGQAVELSRTEQKLLRYFIGNRGITLSRDRLIDRIWTDGAEYVDENALSVAVKRLRDKMSAQPYIKTVYGVGYVWKKEPYE